MSSFNDISDDVTTFYMHKYDSSEQPAAIVFEDLWCRGYHGYLFAPKEFDRVENYTTTDLYERNIINDTASSIMVPHGLSITLYEGSVGVGKEYTLHGQPFTSSTRGMECILFRDVDGLNQLEDKVSSAKVWRTGGPMAQGYWYNAANGIQNVSSEIQVSFNPNYAIPEPPSTELMNLEM